MMRALRRLAPLPLALLLAVAPARGHHVDPFALVDEAMQAYFERESYVDMRAVLSRGLREGAHDGRHDLGFAIVFGIYADVVRFEGNPAFSLHLTDEGLRLVYAQPEIDREFENLLLVSRAYALAELGRYGEAVEAARISALWMGERFGEDARRGLETEIAGWAARATDGQAPGLPDAVEIAIRLIQEAEALAGRGDTAAAHALASRALLPDGTGIDPLSLRFINAWSLAVSGYAFRLEGRLATGRDALRRAADLVAGRPWAGDGLDPPLDDFLREAGGRRLAWDIFSNLGTVAAMLEEAGLAEAALAVAAPLADTPERRFSLLVQQAAVMIARRAFAEAHAALLRSAADAEAVGDTANAALARLYAVIARLYQAEGEETEALLDDLVVAARQAADLADGDLQRREFVLATAVQQAVMRGAPSDAALPLAREALAAFRQRQATVSGSQASHDSVRRERRRFLEALVAAEFEAAGR